MTLRAPGRNYGGDSPFALSSSKGDPGLREAVRGSTCSPRTAKLSGEYVTVIMTESTKDRRESARRVGAWRSLVAHLLWEQGVGGSNPLAPTIKERSLRDRPDQ